ncbi:MAG: ABC transporter substrate-binding protein [Dorea sp.]
MRNEKKTGRIGMAVSVFVLVVFAMTGVLWMNEHKKQESQEETGRENVKMITIGFSQVGAESGWRTGNSISMKETFSEERGYDLIFDDAQQRQEQQIKAIRSFIQQGVDYIVLAPVVETGWDTVLKEAKRMEIPVIIMDRKVEVENENLYTAWVGADFYLEGQKACTWLREYAKIKGKKSMNIVQIQGTLGSTAQLGRTQALEEAANENGWNILEQQNGEFTQAKGQEVMEEFLNKYDNIDVVYCENDNEALGAIEAIESSDRTLGINGEIVVVSFDATQEGLKAVQEGKIAVNVECNPLIGTKVEKVIKQLEQGTAVEKEYYIEENIYAYDDQIPVVDIGGSRYKVEVVTNQLIQERIY